MWSIIYLIIINSTCILYSKYLNVLFHNLLFTCLLFCSETLPLLPVTRLWGLWVMSCQNFSFYCCCSNDSRWLLRSLMSLLTHSLLLTEILAGAGIKPEAFWLQEASCSLLATFTDSILAPRWRGSCFRRPWQRRERLCGWTSATCRSRWTRPATAPSSSSLSPSTTSSMTPAPSETGQQKVSCQPGAVSQLHDIFQQRMMSCVATSSRPLVLSLVKWVN